MFSGKTGPPLILLAVVAFQALFFVFSGLCVYFTRENRASKLSRIYRYLFFFGAVPVLCITAVVVGVWAMAPLNWLSASMIFAAFGGAWVALLIFRKPRITDWSELINAGGRSFRLNMGRSSPWGTENSDTDEPPSTGRNGGPPPRPQ